MNAAIIVGEQYNLATHLGPLPVVVEAADQHEVVYRALDDQAAINLGWLPTSYGTYEASMAPTRFARDAVMKATAPTNPSDGAVTQPNPAPSDAPSLVELDAKEAVLAAVLAWDEAVTIRQGTVQTYTALRAAVREYREVSR